jgi:hypothetical protein
MVIQRNSASGAAHPRAGLRDCATQPQREQQQQSSTMTTTRPKKNENLVITRQKDHERVRKQVGSRKSTQVKEKKANTNKVAKAKAAAENAGLNPLSDLNYVYDISGKKVRFEFLVRFEFFTVWSLIHWWWNRKKVEVTLFTSKYFGQYGAIQKVTPKKFKIRFWDTGEETYLWQTSVTVLPNHSSNQNQKNVQTDDTTINENKQAK